MDNKNLESINQTGHILFYKTPLTVRLAFEIGGFVSMIFLPRYRI